MSDRKRKEYPAGELMSATSHGSGSSTSTYYKIEVRTSYHDPLVLGDGDNAFVVDHCWRTLQIGPSRSLLGVNIPTRSWDTDALRHGLLSYTAAEAHRWAFLASLEAHRLGGALCVETRLVSCKFHLNYKIEEEGVSAALVDQRAPEMHPRFPDEEPTS